MRRAQTEFQDSLVFALNGKSDGEASPFEEPQQLFAALRFIATRYRDARLGKVACPDFDLAIRNDVNGWHYEAHQSELTMGKYRNWYTTTWQRRNYQLEEHIGIGSSKDPRHTIRIAFCWDPKRQKVVIGFIGQHQETDAT